MVQAGITRIDNFTPIDRMLEQTKEPVSLIVGSFAVVEGWLKRMFRLKEQGKVIRLELVLNSSILTRHREMILLLEQICDAVYLTETHAKFVYLYTVSPPPTDFQLVTIMSANATANYRVESYVMTDDRAVVNKIKQDIQNLKNAAVKL